MGGYNSGAFHEKGGNAWTRFFTPHKTLFLFLSVCFCIEGSQYLRLYDATYDPRDLLAYTSILVPLFVLDVFESRHS